VLDAFFLHFFVCTYLPLFQRLPFSTYHYLTFFLIVISHNPILLTSWKHIRDLGSKFKKKHPPVKDAAHSVPPESFYVEQKHDTKAVEEPVRAALYSLFLPKYIPSSR
jgi:hypothetical protein